MPTIAREWAAAHPREPPCTLMLAAIGLPRLVRCDALLGWAAVITLLAALYVNASATMWWAGDRSRAAAIR